jgi:hypothetical protein
VPDQSGCVAQLTVGPQTSCPFAEAVLGIVRSAYAATGHVPATVTASSPVTGQTYTLQCTINAAQEIACGDYPQGTAIVVIQQPAVTG